MEVIHYYPKGTCSVEMFIEHENEIIQKVKIVRGCPGNTQGLAALLVGMPLKEAMERLEGIQCRNGTSCPDQLAKAIRQYFNK